MTRKQKYLISRWLMRLVIVGSLGWLLVIMGLTIIIHTTGTNDEAAPSDAIVVLGAGITRNGRPGYALVRRASHAAELFHAGYADTIICTGGQAPDRPRSEAEACREVLGWRDVPASAVILEDQSRSTEENALFTAPIVQRYGFEDVLLVSDSYHMFRADYLFKQENMDVSLSPVPAQRIRGGASTYTSSVMREIVALHWQVFKDTLGLPFTNSPL